MKKLFKRVATFLKPYAKHVTLLADRGFRDHESGPEHPASGVLRGHWAKLCLSVGWRFRIRVTKNTMVTFPTGRVGGSVELINSACNRVRSGAFRISS